ncbi:hypothetical protein JOQ06_028653, partial [Pogonophryne albipinna]
INIGMMSPQGVDLKPRRGKTLPLFTDPEVAAPAILERAVQKMKAFNKDMDEGPEEMNVTLPAIIANLSQPIDHGRIENAASVDALREMTMRHSTMLQTAGCLRHVASVEGKKGIVSDYLQWYIIGRNSSVIDRFKEGLSALQFLNALQQHPTLLAPVL